MTEPIRVLFCCTANICRSPYAELLARHLTDVMTTDRSAALAAGRHGGGLVTYASAGTWARPGERMDPAMAAALGRRGVTSVGFESRPLSLAMVDDADLVITASGRHRGFVLDDRPEAFRRVFVFGQLAAGAATVPDAVHGRDFLTAVGQAQRPARAADDLPDPFGADEQVVEAVAARLDDLVTALVARLVGS